MSEKRRCQLRVGLHPKTWATSNMLIKREDGRFYDLFTGGGPYFANAPDRILKRLVPGDILEFSHKRRNFLRVVTGFEIETVIPDRVRRFIVDHGRPLPQPSDTLNPERE